MPSIHTAPPQFLLDALYCLEDHIQGEEAHHNDDDDDVEDDPSSEHKPSLDFTGQDDHLWEDEDLGFLLNKEMQEHELCSGFEGSPVGFVEVREEAVEWLVRVVGYYSFSALTAVLAVNYLDRFLRGLQLQQSVVEKPWMAQLAAVGCLSLAAKVEETQVPLLLDFQVEESKYVFEPKTIQRMEILILSTLQWRMNPVTPLSFLHHIVRRLGLKEHLWQELLRRCECLLLSAVHDSRFLSHLPSALATATMLYVISSLEPCIGVAKQDQLEGILGINRDKVKDCCGLIQEVATNPCFQSGIKRKLGSLPMPCSPTGVMEVTFSSGTSSSSIGSPGSSVSSSPEPLSKKIKSWTAENLQLPNDI